jgi:hypothetical protein
MLGVYSMARRINEANFERSYGEAVVLFVARLSGSRAECWGYHYVSLVPSTLSSHLLSGDSLCMCAVALALLDVDGSAAVHMSARQCHRLILKYVTMIRNCLLQFIHYAHLHVNVC